MDLDTAPSPAHSGVTGQDWQVRSSKTEHLGAVSHVCDVPDPPALGQRRADWVVPVSRSMYRSPRG